MEDQFCQIANLKTSVDLVNDQLVKNKKYQGRSVKDRSSLSDLVKWCQFEKNYRVGNYYANNER